MPVARLTWVYEHWVLTTSLWSSELSKLTANARHCAKPREPIFRRWPTLSDATNALAPIWRIVSLVYMCASLKLYEVASYWNQVLVVNEWQKKRFAAHIVNKMFQTIAGKKIAVLGFAFKKNTDDTRESPARAVVQYLLEERADVSLYDPKARLHHGGHSTRVCRTQNTPSPFRPTFTSASRMRTPSGMNFAVMTTRACTHS